MKNILQTAVFCLILNFLQAQPGTNDQSFNIGTGFNDAVFETAIQADGKIIASGYFTTYNGLSQNRLVRLNPDGSLDNTFNIGTGFNGGALTISIQADGKIIVGGEFTTYNGNVANRLVRLNNDGTVDNSFNIGIGFNNFVYSINIQTDGKIIVGGAFALFNGSLHRGLIRLNIDGSLDNSFNPSSFNGNVYTTAIQSDGKIIAGGNFISFNGTNVGAIARINTDGSLDASFNTGTGYNSEIWTTSIQSDGKIIVGGYFTSFNGTAINRISRLNTDGSLDATFNIGTGFGGEVFTSKVQTDGKIIVGGFFNSFNGSARNRLARLNTDGSLDATFNIGSGFGNDVLTTAIQSDGKIIVGGNFSNVSSLSRNRLARLRVCDATNSTDVISSCTPITWINGNIYSSSNNTATFTLSNAVGCDSIVTLNFTRLTQSSENDIITSCDPITWIDGNTYTASNNTATFTLSNAAGCDSIVTLNFTKLTPTSAVDIISSCNPITWIDGNSYSSSNNTATFTIINAAGCDSVVTLNFTRIIVDIATSTSGQTITAIVPGSDYQWIDCNNNNTAIAGETNQSYVAGSNGSYAVIVTNNGCTDTSACVNITSTGMNNVNQFDISIYPNPFTDQTLIKLSEEISNPRIELFNVLGEKIKSFSFSGKEFILNRYELKPGIYFLHLNNKDRHFVKEIIIH
jgi:uncharacterized delta-60 repeat protein